MASGSFAALATVAASTVSWYDTTGLIQGASYTYRIKAKNYSNESVYSNEVTVINAYLDAPSSLVATAGSDNKIELTWTDNSIDETGFEIWRYIYGNGNYQLYASVDVNTTHFTDTNVSAGIQYNYMVRAFKLPVSIYSPYSRKCRCRNRIAHSAFKSQLFSSLKHAGGSDLEGQHQH